MSLITSTDFASICVEGTDWRDAAKAALEQLEEARTKPEYYNFGFLYVSDGLSDDLVSIINLFKSVLGIEHWVSASSRAVVGHDQVCSGDASISVMICRFPDNSFCSISDHDHDHDHDEEYSSISLKDWLQVNNPVFSLVHPIGETKNDIVQDLELVNKASQSFMIGGIGSDIDTLDVPKNMFCPVIFSEDVPISTAIAQGVGSASPFRTITKADDNTILEIDNERALDVFEKDLRSMAAEKLERNADYFVASLQGLRSSDHIPKEFKTLFQGQVHIALPIRQSDQRNFVVQNIVNIDTDEGSISISENVGVGDAMLVVERNADTMRADLAEQLVKLRKRVQAERQSFLPKAALYISCASRIHDQPDQDYEMNMIRDVIGTVPITGFYARGEIYNARLHSHSSILVLFF